MEQRLRGDAISIFQAALEAVDPFRAVLAHLSLDGRILKAGGNTFELDPGGRILVVGAGKACAPMAAAVERVLGDRIADGLVAVKDPPARPVSRIGLMQAGHPVPDARGVEAARGITRIVESAEEKDLVVCLFSGGGSALLPSFAPPITLEEVAETTRLLLASGADIRAINSVRKHISLLKGGGLARLAHPARVLTLVLSDVVGDPPDVIASGPTVPDPTTYKDALAVLDSHSLRERVPASILARLTAGAAGKLPETPKPGSAIFSGTRYVLVGNNRAAMVAAAEGARLLGYQSLVLTTSLTGEARHAAAFLAAVAREVLASSSPCTPPACLLAGGETTVTVRSRGKGGRNAEFSLASALGIEGLPGVVVLSAGTDGTDGETDAAGALADGNTVRRAREAGMDPEKHLADNDSYPLFLALGDLLITGPTNTNVMDLHIFLISK